MFTKKNKSENTNSNNKDNNEKNKESTIKSWLTGKLGSLLIFSAVGYALYKFGIITKITSYFKKDKGKERDNTQFFSNPNDNQDQSSSTSSS